MAANLDLSIRHATAWDIIPVVGTFAGAIATSSVARWMPPNAETHARHLQPRLAAAEQIPARAVRVADDDGQSIGAALPADWHDQLPSEPASVFLVARTPHSASPHCHGTVAVSAVAPRRAWREEARHHRSAVISSTKDVKRE